MVFRLLSAAFIFLYSSYSFSGIERHELWSGGKSALAFCVLAKASSCYVISDELKVNVSQVENLNLGKLGLSSKYKYEKVITFPVEWLKSGDGELMVLFKTQAWMAGKRYTVTEPVLIKNGKYVVR